MRRRVKGLLALILAVALVVTIMPYAEQGMSEVQAAELSKGTDGYYVVNSADDLQTLAENILSGEQSVYARLNTDVTVSIAPYSGNLFQLDLNGHTLTGDETSDKTAVITAAQQLVIEDSSSAGTGTIQAVNGQYALANKYNNAVQINGGRIRATSYPAICANQGTYTLTKGSVYSASDSAIGIAAGTQETGSGISFDIQGGTVVSDAASAAAVVLSVANSTLSMNSGSITGAYGGVSVAEDCSGTLTGGTIEATGAAGNGLSGYAVRTDSTNFSINADTLYLKSTAKRLFGVRQTGDSFGNYKDLRGYSESTDGIFYVPTVTATLTESDDAGNTYTCLTGGTQVVYYEGYYVTMHDDLTGNYVSPLTYREVVEATDAELLNGTYPVLEDVDEENVRHIFTGWGSFDGSQVVALPQEELEGFIELLIAELPSDGIDLYAMYQDCYKLTTSVSMDMAKVYDGNVNVSNLALGTVTGIQEDFPDVAINASAVYATADAGTGKLIHVHYSLSGADAEHYIAPEDEDYTTGVITPAAGSAEFTQYSWYVGESRPTPVIASVTNGTTGVTYFYKSAGAPDTAYTTTVPSAAGSYTAKAVFAATTNYQEVSKTSDFTISYLPMPEVPYTLSGMTGNNGWYTGSVAIVPASNYLISSTADGAMSGNISVDTTIQNMTIYLRTASGARTEAIQVGRIQVDGTAPAFNEMGDGITIEGSNWRSLLETIQYGLFYQNAKTVTVQAEDNESGIAGYEYLVSEVPLTIAQLQSSQAWKAGATFTIDAAAQEQIIYARVTNQAGMASYISTDGIVYDTTAPVIRGIVNGEFYYAEKLPVTVTDDYLQRVTVNGKAVTVNGTSAVFDLTPADEAYTITAQDVTGNTTTYKVTVEESWIRDGIASSGKKKLVAGTAYKLGSGKWQIAGDSTVYEGGRTFYAASSGEYDFQKR